MQILNNDRHNVAHLPQRKREPVCVAPRQAPGSLKGTKKRPAPEPSPEYALQSVVAQQAERIEQLERIVESLSGEVAAGRKEMELRAEMLAMSEDLVKRFNSRLSLADILNVVQDASTMPVELLQGPRRSRSCAWPRQMFCWLAKTYAPLASLPQIGRAIGDRDHTTALHAIRAVEQRLAEGDPGTVMLRDLCVARLEAISKERAGHDQ